ncbi:16363_t:CDS:2 [Acaulospora colombiana]|uniref:16363_t:CDS:1 n=1 Tax=Acaulospora colombiana TaxID=27376 RepID=A0ACA9NKC3_9GLOM|nr:16363_t:CDS:2 [Acaulospora colombiana]
MASKYWEQEPEAVKIEYRRIAKEAFDYHNEIYPKKRYQGKREKWNIVSFNKLPKKPSRKDRSIEKS